MSNILFYIIIYLLIGLIIMLPRFKQHDGMNSFLLILWLPELLISFSIELYEKYMRYKNRKKLL